MSLELAINENTQAIYALLAEIKGGNLRTPIPPYETKVAPCVGHAVEQEKAEEKAAPNDQIIRQALKDVYRIHGKEKLAELLGKYKAKAFQDLKPESYEAVLADVEVLA